MSLASAIKQKSGINHSLLLSVALESKRNATQVEVNAQFKANASLDAFGDLQTVFNTVRRERRALTSFARDMPHLLAEPSGRLAATASALATSIASSVNANVRRQWEESQTKLESQLTKTAQQVTGGLLAEAKAQGVKLASLEKLIKAGKIDDVLQQIATDDFLSQFDDAGRKLATEAVTQVLKQGNVKQIVESIAPGSIKDDIKRLVDGYQGAVAYVSSLGETAQTIANAASSLSENVGVITEALTQNRTNAFANEVLTKVLFSSGPAAELRSQVDHACSTYTELRQAATRVIDARDRLTSSSTSVLDKGQAVVDLMENLGVADAHVKKARETLALADTAVSVFNAVSTGNTVGAVMSVMGAFGVGGGMFSSGGGAASNAPILEMLGRLESKVDALLEGQKALIEGQKKIIEYQQKILEAVEVVSNQIAEFEYNITNQVIWVRQLVMQRYIENLNHTKNLLVAANGARIIDVTHQRVPRFDELAQHLRAKGVTQHSSEHWKLFDCWRRPNFDRLCRLNFDQGKNASRRTVGCG
jgi:hypothetical protein